MKDVTVDCASPFDVSMAAAMKMWCSENLNAPFASTMSTTWKTGSATLSSQRQDSEAGGGGHEDDLPPDPVGEEAHHRLGDQPYHLRPGEHQRDIACQRIRASP